MKIFITGKIHGESISACTMKFGTIQDELTKLGHEAVNPLEVVIGSKPGWKYAMKQFIRLFLECDALFILADYQSCRESSVLVNLAATLNIPVFGSLKEVKRANKVNNQ